jgi:radical SAM protein with 4Fe4S-binding SPASM domain
VKTGIRISAKWNEFRVLASTLTALKILNYGKLLAGYFFSRWTGRPYQWGKPFSVSIEPTTSCNLRCPECPSGLRSFSRPTGMLENGLFSKLLDELSPELTYLTFYFQGEPFLNPKFLQMVSVAAKRKIYTSTSTNAHYLKDDTARETIESGLHRIIISIDGTTSETYESYRIGGQLDKVLEGTRNLVKWKKKLQSATPHIVFQFLVVKQNEHQIPEVYRLAEELGVDEVKLKTAQIYNFENGSELIPEQEKYSRYKKNQWGKFEIKNQLLNQCWQMWNSCVITWDGKVVPCCFDKDAAHSLGEAGKNQHFENIWFGPGYYAFRSSILQSRKQIDICRNCTEGMEVWA